MKNGIVVIGTVFVDIKGYPITKYIPGGRNAGRVVQVHGGVSRNVVEDIANVELRPTFVSAVDPDGIGRDVIEKLTRHKVNTRYIRFVPDGMGTWLAVFDNSGDVIASISKRPDTTVIGEILNEQGDEIFAEADSIAVEIDIEEKILKRIFQLAEKHGKRVYALVSNMTIAMERRDLLRRVDCLVCNAQEAGLFFSEDYSGITPDRMAEVLASRIQDGAIPRMVVTMGGEGAVYASREGENGTVPAVNVDIVDTTGCGDAF
ncbi:MAG: carbohydrate kinase family protein, partial [Clostridia bacterium]|nr:carbohydrate kinase family protein [Clostridia bacterium]